MEKDIHTIKKMCFLYSCHIIKAKGYTSLYETFLHLATTTAKTLPLELLTPPATSSSRNQFFFFLLLLSMCLPALGYLF